MNYGPQVEDSDRTHAEKYRKPGETFRERMAAIANHLKDDDLSFQELYSHLCDMSLVPAGRIQAGCGTDKSVTLLNCFVSAEIHDSFTDGPEQWEIDISTQAGRWQSVSIMDAAKMAAQTMRKGGGIGYDFSTMRPSGDLIVGVQSRTDGPMAFAPIFNATCQATSSAGNRRGAQMMVMRVDHPDIEKFILAKNDSDSLRGFNMSVAITDEFMHAVANDATYDLKFKDRVYRRARARDIWNMIMRSAYDYAEPGVIFIDTINRMNNLYYCETITTTNPCGEQPLPPHGSCLLGSLNLVKLLNQERTDLDWHKVERAARIFTRALDNVIDRSCYPLPEQEQEAKLKRRIGIGLMGVANALEACGLPYGTREAVTRIGSWMKKITHFVYDESVNLAIEKGPFPKFDAELYCNSRFIQRLEPWLQKRIREYGIRNSHLTSIAPTGTISYCADNVSSGIEPVFSEKYERDVITENGKRTFLVLDYGVRYLGVKPRTSDQVKPLEHVSMVTETQKWVDSAISKTINMPNDIPWSEFEDVYLKAYQEGAKGCTVYRAGAGRDAVLRKVEEGVCTIDPVTGAKSCE